MADTRELLLQSLGPFRALFEPAPIERYVRCSVMLYGAPRIDGFRWVREGVGSIEVGLQYDDPPSAYRSKLREVTEVAARVLGDRALDVNTADEITRDLDARIVGLWGADRGRFIEVWTGAGDAAEALTQIYAPCGMPRVR